MTEEVQNLAEVDSAPATDVTATPEVAQSTPEVADQHSLPRHSRKRNLTLLLASASQENSANGNVSKQIGQGNANRASRCPRNCRPLTI
jgi:hypothetical protein